MHTLYIGDVLEQLDKIAQQSIDLVITDPPYAVLQKGKTGWGLGYKPANWDVFSTIESFREFTEKWFEELKSKVKPDTFIFIFWSQKRLSLGQEIFKPQRTIIWRYNNLINNPKGDFAYDYEPIFVVKVGKPKLKKSCRSVLEYSKPQSNFVKDRAVYTTQKPRKLIDHLLDVVGLPEGSTVLDCFQGSGVVGERAVLLGHNYIGIDESPDSELVSEKLLSDALLERAGMVNTAPSKSRKPTILIQAQQQDIFTYLAEIGQPLPVQAINRGDNRVHYIYTSSQDGAEHTYRRRLSGLWYDRDMKLLRKQLLQRSEEVKKEEIR